MTKECPVNMEAALERIEGDLELYKIIINTLLNDYPEEMKKLSQHICSSNYEAVKRAAHKAKGAVSAIGAQRAQELFFHLENMGREKNLDLADEILGEINEELLKIKDWADNLFV
jgi:HPt (histidine-containing phosphotransfer) domain-containing protein